jgi:hypothetical protein
LRSIKNPIGISGETPTYREEYKNSPLDKVRKENQPRETRPRTSCKDFERFGAPQLQAFIDCEIVRREPES